MGISMDFHLPNCSLSGSKLNSPHCRVAIGQLLLRIPSLTVSCLCVCVCVCVCQSCVCVSVSVLMMGLVLAVN